MKLLVFLSLVGISFAYHLDFDFFDTKFDQFKNDVDKKLAEIEAKKPGLTKEVNDAVARNDAAKKEQLKGPIGEIFEVLHQFDNALREEQQKEGRTSSEKMWISGALGKVHKLWKEFTALRQLLNPKKPDQPTPKPDRFKEWAEKMGKRLDAAQVQVRSDWKNAQNAVMNKDKTAKKRILETDVPNAVKVLDKIKQDVDSEKQSNKHSDSETAQISQLEQRNAQYVNEYAIIKSYLNSKENFPDF